MRLKFFYGEKPKLTENDRQDFSRGNYECVKLMATRRGSPVVISQSKDPGFPMWRVDYDYSCVFFKSYSKALAFCKGRFVDAERGKT